MSPGIDLLGALTRVRPERAPPAIDASRLQRLLLIKLSSIGDVVHALPFATALKRAHPGLRLSWAIEDWTAPLVIGHPAVDRLIVFPSPSIAAAHPSGWLRAFREAVRALRSESYDVAVDLQGLARSAAVSVLSRAPLRIARAGQREGAHLVSYGVPLPDSRLHAVEEYLQVARSLGARGDEVSFELQVDRRASLDIDRMLADIVVARGRPLVVATASAAQRWKEWDRASWARVFAALSEIGMVVLVGTGAQAEAHAAIAREVPEVRDITGKTTLAELVALIARANLHVAPDTGSVHIAAALGVPVVGVYGPTRPWRVGPYGQPDAAIDHGDRCGRWCPAFCRRKRACLRAVTPDEVTARAQKVLSAGARSVERR